MALRRRRLAAADRPVRGQNPPVQVAGPAGPSAVTV
jgi:hypothetical protein